MIEPIISQEDYNKLTGNNYSPILLNDYEMNFIINLLEKNFSNNYDSKFLFMYNKLTKFRNDKK